MSSLPLVDPLNNRHPQAWRPLDCSSIQSISIPKEATLDDLLGALKSIASESVSLLYGHSTDDKYQKIVNLLMYRVRASMNEMLQALQSSASQSQLTPEAMASMLEKAKSSIISQIEDMSSYEQIHFDEQKYKKIYDEALSNARSAMSEELAQREAKLAADEAKRRDYQAFRSAGDEQTQPSSSAAQQKHEDTAAAAGSPAEPLEDAVDERKAQQMSQHIAESIVPMLHDAMSGAKLAGSASDAVDSTLLVPAVQAKKAAREVEAVDKQMEAVERKTSSPALQVSSSKNSYGIFSSKQFQIVSKHIKTSSYQQKQLIDKQMKSVTDSFKKTCKKIDEIKDVLDTSKFPWMTIMLFAAGILVPIFWDKIKAFLGQLNKKFDIDSKIDQLIDSIDWSSHIEKVVDLVTPIIWKKIQDWIFDPQSGQLSLLSNMWNNITEWYNNIKDNVAKLTGSSIEQANERNDKTDKSISKQIEDLRRDFEKSVKRESKSNDDAIAAVGDDVAQHVSDSYDKVNGEIGQMQRSTKSDAEEVISQVKASHESLANSTIPDAQKSIGSSFSDTVDQFNSGQHQLLSDAENRLNETSDKLEAKLSGLGSSIENLDPEDAKALEKATEQYNKAVDSADQQIKNIDVNQPSPEFDKAIDWMTSDVKDAHKSAVEKTHSPNAEGWTPPHPLTEYNEFNAVKDLIGSPILEPKTKTELPYYAKPAMYQAPLPVTTNPTLDLAHGSLAPKLTLSNIDNVPASGQANIIYDGAASFDRVMQSNDRIDQNVQAACDSIADAQRTVDGIADEVRKMKLSIDARLSDENKPRQPAVIDLSRYMSPSDSPCIPR